MVDDNSSDGIAKLVERIKEEKNYSIELIKRPKKLGIGSTYIKGFKKALELNSALYSLSLYVGITILTFVIISILHILKKY